MKSFNQLRNWCLETFHYYVVFKNSIYFILGLLLSYKLVEKTFLNILIAHLGDMWKSESYDLRKAVVVVSFREGTSAVLLPLFAYVADVYTGRFRMIICSTAVCIIGLLLNVVSAIHEDHMLNIGLFFSSLLLITLAEAGQTIALQAFLEDQLRPVYPDDDVARTRYSKFWTIVVSLVAAIFAIWPLSKFKFGNLVIVLTSVMGGCFLLFLLGIKYYEFVDKIENPFKDVGVVINTAIVNRNVEYPQTQAGYFTPAPAREGLFDDSSHDVHISPRVPWLRWLDKAAIVTDAELAHHRPSVEQVRSVKFLLKMLPLWSCFLTFSLVVASGSTFFIEEASSLTVEYDIRPILILDNLLKLTEFVVSETSTYVIEKLRDKKNYKEQKMQLVRIGIGMACCVPCCIVAWATATRRQHDQERGSEYTTMNVYSLTPQFLLLGLMAGLSQEGLQLFYESQVLKSLSTYGPPFGEFIMGFGKFLSILCILIFGNTQFKWFQSNLDDSRLNRYYMFLAVLSFVNAMILCLVLSWYEDHAFLLEDAVDEEMGPIAHLLEDDGLASRSIIDQGQHGSRGPLSNRIVLKPDIIEESSVSGSKEEEEEEGPEEPFLANKKDSTYYNMLRLRMATTFLRLFSGAARRRSDPTPLIKKD